MLKRNAVFRGTMDLTHWLWRRIQRTWGGSCKRSWWTDGGLCWVSPECFCRRYSRRSESSTLLNGTTPERQSTSHLLQPCSWSSSSSFITSKSEDGKTSKTQAVLTKTQFSSNTVCPQMKLVTLVEFSTPSILPQLLKPKRRKLPMVILHPPYFKVKL